MKTDAVIDEPKSQQVFLGCSAVCQQEGPFSAVLSAPALKETDHNSDRKVGLYTANVEVLHRKVGLTSYGAIMCRNMSGQGSPGSEQTTDQRGFEAS